MEVLQATRAVLTYVWSKSIFMVQTSWMHLKQNDENK